MAKTDPKQQPLDAYLRHQFNQVADELDLRLRLLEAFLPEVEKVCSETVPEIASTALMQQAKGTLCLGKFHARLSGVVVSAMRGYLVATERHRLAEEAAAKSAEATERSMRWATWIAALATGIATLATAGTLAISIKQCSMQAETNKPVAASTAAADAARQGTKQ